jgi:Protein of unknown function (DUF1569)
MKNLFEVTTVEEVKERMALLSAENARQWGKMNAAQAVEHCARGMELALGDRRPPRMLVGRILGLVVKPMAFRDGEPMRKNSPTVPGLEVEEERDLEKERERLCGLIDRFAAGGPGGCTTHPHSFFGRLTPEEWSAWMYKHLDHHLRQFGV